MAQLTPVGLAPANSTNVAPVPTIVFPGTIVTKAFGPVKPLLLHPVANVSPNDSAAIANATKRREILREVFVLSMFFFTVCIWRLLDPYLPLDFDGELCFTGIGRLGVVPEVGIAHAQVLTVKVWVVDHIE